MATEIAVAAEAEVEDLRHCGIAVRERKQAISDVSRREHSVRLPEPAGAAAVVGGGHDGRQPIPIPGWLPTPPRREKRLLQTLQNHREACSTPQRDDPAGPGQKWSSRRLVPVLLVHFPLASMLALAPSPSADDDHGPKRTILTVSRRMRTSNQTDRCLM